MKHNKIAIIGAGGLGRVMLDFIQSQGYNVVSFIDDNFGNYRNGVCQLPVRDFNSLNNLINDGVFFILAILDPVDREKLIQKLNNIDISFINFVSPTAFLSPHSSLGNGCCVLDNTNIMNGAILDSYIHVHFQTAIGHDAIVGPYTTFGPNCIIGGFAKIGKGVKFGMGVRVLPNIAIGDYSIIGAGSVVTKPIPPGEVWSGVPAKPIHITQATDAK